ncbi:hypothetical protein CHS0354_040668 [Potamilus streckersoni]|uniref:Uncharacterized protein n=1 Tax=Potamilus streckersoni TaxID=2493646 RepID=A0AAE0TDJ3_9BIVA|nr:hypothetical protein CHS0354_040668 [Potamilus streckersoni]
MLKILQAFFIVVLAYLCHSFILQEVDILIDEATQTELAVKANNKLQEFEVIILKDYPDDLEPELELENANCVDVMTDDSDDMDPDLDLVISDDEKIDSTPVAFLTGKSGKLSIEAEKPMCKCLPSGESCTIKVKSKTVYITVRRNDSTDAPHLIVILNYSGESWTKHFTVMETPDVRHTFIDNLEISLQVGFKGLGEVCLYLSKPFVSKLACCKLIGSEAIDSENPKPEVDSDLGIPHSDRTKSELVNVSETSPKDHKVVDVASHKEANSDPTLHFQPVIIN